MSVICCLSYLPINWSSGVYICKSIVNYLRHGNYIVVDCWPQAKAASGHSQQALLIRALVGGGVSESRVKVVVGLGRK